MIPTLFFSISLLLSSLVAETPSASNSHAVNQDSNTAEETTPKSAPATDYWAGSDMEAAQKEAQRRSVPILLLIVRDGDPICDSWAQQHLEDPAFLKALETHGVPALACITDQKNELHKPVSSETDSCPLHGCKNCLEHQGSETLIKDLPIPRLLPRIYLIDRLSGESRALPEDLPFRGAKALSEYLDKRTEENPPTRIQYRFLQKHLERAVEYNGYEDFEKGCQELAAAKRLLPIFGQEMADQWDLGYAPYRGRGIQMIRKAKEALKTNRIMGTRMLTRVAKIMAGLPEGERARHLLNALQPKN
ncbi:hypothetical protein CBD41_07745 [bacterium TMED181]|nr:hypothetical protein [Planctomycetota bacterium]OUW43127.1 MAG: hypothetical protein CBD41_07745 [bacterium TMED181]